ncbi:hypothetical protein [Streptomyces alboflavus]|uniref:hypothetical protein n=1 Tax=Streptomyces alboflavus TaxID=67267 RepID=UPI001331AFE1|nr:hypothetical protein [Streptomyces alboflavus]
MSNTGKGYMTIPPSDRNGRTRLEKEADALLRVAGEEKGEDRPAPWPEREETDFDRMAAACSGMLSLADAVLAAMQPALDPEAGREEIRRLMEERPGAGEATTLAHLLDAPSTETDHGSGFTIQRKSFPSERCQWLGCNESLYAPEKPSKAGKPRKYCQAHRKASRARTQRLRRAGIHVGKNRNLIYEYEGLEGQQLDGYREVWGHLNTIRVQ